MSSTRDIPGRLRALKLGTYADYLKSGHWWEVKRRYFRSYTVQKDVEEFGRPVCKACGAQKNLNLHHATYERLGHEELTDLVLLCRDCHGQLHECCGDADLESFTLQWLKNPNRDKLAKVDARKKEHKRIEVWVDVESGSTIRERNGTVTRLNQISGSQSSHLLGCLRSREVLDWHRENHPEEKVMVYLNHKVLVKQMTHQKIKAHAEDFAFCNALRVRLQRLPKRQVMLVYQSRKGSVRQMRDMPNEEEYSPREALQWIREEVYLPTKMTQGSAA